MACKATAFQSDHETSYSDMPCSVCSPLCTSEWRARSPRYRRDFAEGDSQRQRQRVLRQGKVAWAHERGVQLRLIEPGKPNQNAYIESFNGRFRDECLNEHWFPSLLHARTEIEIWRREYNEERPKKALGGLTPADYAKQLT